MIINDQWYYAVIDVISILTYSSNPGLLAGPEKRFAAVGFEETLKQLERFRQKQNLK